MSWAMDQFSDECELFMKQNFGSSRFSKQYRSALQKIDTAFHQSKVKNGGGR